MANQTLTPDVIAKEALMQLKNELHFGRLAHREYKNEFVKVGETVKIRKPVKFVTSDGANRVNQDVEEGNTTITIDQRKHVSWGFSTQDLTLDIEKYSERYIKPAMITIAQTIDAAGAALYKQIANAVGTPGVTPSNYLAVGAASQRLTEMAVPTGSDRRGVLTPGAFQAIAATLTTLNMPAEARAAWTTSEIGNLAGFRTHESVNIKNHVVGLKAGTPLVNGASQETTYALSKTTDTQTLVTDGWTISQNAVKEGDVITMAGVYAVNPVPGEGNTGKTVMPYLRQFVVRADADANGSGQATLTIHPAIITSGPYQTVSAAPADNAAITVLGTAGVAYPQNMFFHKNALALVTVPLEMPDGVSWKSRQTDEGLSVRLVKQYDIDTDQDVVRIDVLYGWKAIYPELAVRLFG